MQTLRLSAAIPSDLDRAAALLRAGELAALPTETVYGLAANALDGDAVAKIFTAKGRPQDNPLIVHVPGAADAAALAADFPPEAQRLADVFWPGPLTIILPSSGMVAPAVSAGLPTVALRVPAHPAALALLQAAGIPLAAPSANRSGSPSPTAAAHVLADLDGRIATVLDGGPCGIGVESTVVSLAGESPCLLRPGGVTLAQLRDVLGDVTVSPSVTAPLENGETAASPGMKYRHYAPEASLTLVRGSAAAFAAYAVSCAAGWDGLLCFDEDLFCLRALLPKRSVLLTYGSETDPAAQARLLFARLREMDALGLRRALVHCPSADGAGLAVYNRLLRAASFRVVEATSCFPVSRFP
ncbi:MAG: threonylcarbamoyl-AMP synthase [Oscillospiraceae bacterium]|jgi:L-threonylcarbamoyladenylate synthase|nr:threonylcarbamoyl-AMP synthase [Oscillospiraceae bacterium]